MKRFFLISLCSLSILAQDDDSKAPTSRDDFEAALAKVQLHFQRSIRKCMEKDDDGQQECRKALQDEMLSSIEHVGLKRIDCRTASTQEIKDKCNTQLTELRAVIHQNLQQLDKIDAENK